MRHFMRVFISVLVVWIFAAVARAVGPTAGPTTIPTIPTAQPVVVGRPLVEVFSFTAIGDAGHQDWIGKGISENLQTDVSRTGALLVVAPQTQPANSDPVVTAKQNGANLAVIGSYQIVADDVRVNGHLIDTATNATVGSFSATGPQKDLFRIEDALGEQMRRLLPLPQVSVQPAQETSPGNTAASTPPTVIYSQPAPVTNNYYDSTAVTPYYYPNSFYPSDYGYDYPYYSGFYGAIDVAPGPFFYYGSFGGYGFGHRGYYGGFHANPSFHNPVYHGGGSFGGVHGGGFHGSSGGFHGGGGGGRR